jgi:hypothetical protein
MPRTSAEMAVLASRAMRDPGSLSHDEIESLGASALSSRQEDFDNDDELIVPVPEGHDVPEAVPSFEDFADLGAVEVDAEDETPIEPDVLDAAEDISPKVLTDCFVAQMRGVVIPTRKTAIRMTEFTIQYLTDLARRRAAR